MYQCQMGKQTMATPFHSIPHRVDTKAYRLQTPQSPIVRNRTYDEHSLDDYAMGTNAVVAVISYTGYDMEDAMIINKASYERGFGHGSLYLTVTVDLNDYKRKGEPLTYRFGNLREGARDIKEHAFFRGAHFPWEDAFGLRGSVRPDVFVPSAFEWLDAEQLVTETMPCHEEDQALFDGF